MLDALWTFDQAVDLSVMHSLVSLATAFLVLWLMICRTREAGFTSLRAAMLMAQRVAMAALAVALVASAATPIYNDGHPWAADVAVRALFLTLLVIFALRLRLEGGRI